MSSDEEEESMYVLCGTIPANYRSSVSAYSATIIVPATTEDACSAFASKGILASMKIQRSRQTPRTDRSFEYSEDDLSIASSSSSTSLDHMDKRRHSLESSYSSLLSHLSSSALIHGHPPPPHGARYVKVKSKARHIHKEPTKIAHAQTLQGHPSSPIVGAVWTMKFSKDGTYLAAGGQDCIVRVWKVLGSDSEENNQQTIHIFEKNPVCEYRGHTGDVLDLCWSKSHFLLSSSMDNFVRLWHVSKPECLCAFRHPDFIPIIAFHPKDDRLFLSGSADGKVRLWNIPEMSVVSWNQLPDNSIITAVNFTFDGGMACVGSYDGHMYFYEPKDMKFKIQLAVYSGKVKRGDKVTGIEWMPGSTSDNNKLLVTSNDSRVQLFDVSEQSLIYKYKGAENYSRQIKATFRYTKRRWLFIICGSDKSYVHVWNTADNPTTGFRYLQRQGSKSDISLGQSSGQTAKDADKKSKHKWWHRERRSEHSTVDKHHHEQHFEAHRDSVTCAIFAPAQTRIRIAETGRDIIYNHTPLPSPQNPRDEQQEDQDESNVPSAYTFINGQIMVSSDEHGGIKVWRMDSGVYTTPRKLSTASSSARQKD